MVLAVCCAQCGRHCWCRVGPPLSILACGIHVKKTARPQDHLLTLKSSPCGWRRETDLHWKSHGANLGKGCHLSGPVSAVNKGSEGICENRSVDNRVEGQPLAWLVILFLAPLPLGH